ncbi:MAG TPA: CDGSH iron-sulfur domain-containing protein [Dehalococcoidia bacterium]|nr:CDGSH iron-sulfur domain-containing protein [Dehalococcoidia bacterium]
MEVTITLRDNGPYAIDGDIELLHPSGRPIDRQGKTKIFLCRCGGSTNKPFCDGTHSKIGFQAAEAAAEQADREAAGGS